MENYKRYELLCEDVKWQIKFIDDCYAFDFKYLNENLKEMENLQKQIKESQIKTH